MPSGRQLGTRSGCHAIKHPPGWLTTNCTWDQRRTPSSEMVRITSLSFWGDRGFESTSLQRRVHCEPDFPVRGHFDEKACSVGQHAAQHRGELSGTFALRMLGASGRAHPQVEKSLRRIGQNCLSTLLLCEAAAAADMPPLLSRSESFALFRFISPIPIFKSATSTLLHQSSRLVALRPAWGSYSAALELTGHEHEQSRRRSTYSTRRRNPSR